MQIRRNDDFNGPDQEGAGLYQVTQFWQDGKQGERCSAAAAYLHPVMNRPNLQVITGARATRVLLDGQTATGVAYRKGGAEHHVMAGAEVILSGGAFNSPQLLMLSGIGPGEHLRSRGIEAFAASIGGGRDRIRAAQPCSVAFSPPETRTVLRPGFACMIRDILRFNARADTGLSTDSTVTLGALHGVRCGTGPA